MRVQMIQLRHLAVGAPTLIAIPCLEQVGISELVEAPGRIEPRGELVGDRFVVDEAVVVRGADGLFVELFSVEHAALDPRDLRAYQCSAIGEILRAMPRPYLVLFMVSSQGLEMLLSHVAG